MEQRAAQTPTLIERITPLKGRVGLFSVAHEPYWEQFPGLREQLETNSSVLSRRLSALGVEVVDGGLVDTARRAVEVGEYLRAHAVDLLICHVVTYATSAVVLPVVQRAGVDVVLVGLQPTPGMDCRVATTFDQLLHDNVTSLPEIATALLRAGKRLLGTVVGVLHDDPRAEREIAEWCRVADVLRTVRNARIGYLGHVYEGMLDMHSDPTMFHGCFGLHIEMLEMCDLAVRVSQVTPSQIADMKNEIQRIFHFAEPGVDKITGIVRPEELDWSAQVAVALRHLISDFDLTGLAYYYRGLNDNVYERIAAGMIVGSSIATGSGVPVAGEADLKTCLAMLIMDRLGCGGSFAEFHPLDFRDDIVLVGHDGPAHIRISNERPILRGLSVYHGKRGHGLSVEFKVAEGPVTLLGLTQTHEGRFKFVAATGASVPGEIPQTGNTNTRVSFAVSVAEFVERWTMEGPTHHFALGVGNALSVLRKVARALDIELVVVGER
ncbi:MAG: arabinose isomerase [Limnochordia bacterium]